MTYVITHGCCNDSSCIPVCPVQCIRPRPGDPDFLTTEQLYIDPTTCIDCGACEDACPVSAIHSEWDLPEELGDYLDINAAHFETNPIEESAPPDPVRRRLPAAHPELAVAIVGTGPAGMYAAAELSEIKGVTVTLLDRLPTPFGLVRSGVAPDHTNTRLIAKRFDAVLNRPNVSCYFNVEVGRDLTLEELLLHHHAVIWAGGADDDRRLGIPGEDLAGCVSAREFVAWYNGHPLHSDATYELAGPRVVVIGNGNVALDVARVLARPVESLASTDIADHALTALAASSVREVVVTARRGPEHASYSAGELFGLDHTDGVVICTQASELGTVDAGGGRVAAILQEGADCSRVGDERAVTLRFGLRPVSINGSGGKVESVTFAAADGAQETIEASLVIRAIGYRGRPVPGLPFDDVTGTVCHYSGAVSDPVSGESVPGCYVTGWIKRGATGVIGTNKADSAETVDALLHDLAAGRLPQPTHTPEALADLMRERCADIVDRAGWGRIDQQERSSGRAQGRPRQKFRTIAELVAASREV